jgi:hypothetical protein
MKMASKLFSCIIIAAFIITSCSKETDNEMPDDGIYAIRSIFGYGKTNTKYIYNSFGKIAEYQSFHFCYRYIYDDNGRLIKKEDALATDLFSSASAERSELMTSKNSTFTGYSLYEYDKEGILKSKKYYHKKDDVYEYTSKISFEYENGNIVKWNILNDGDTITQYYAYEYDNNRNVIKEKQYSFLFIEGPGPELIRETTYKYDDKNNPFNIYKETGQPGLFSNKNNVIESNSTLFIDVPGIDKYTTSKTNYEYNDKGFPVKVLSGNSVYEYIYK